MKEKRKNTELLRALRERNLTMADLDFDLVPVAFETSGAMGPSAKKWWKTIKELYAAKNPHGDAALQGRGGSEYTWTADNFVDHWAQRIGTALARAGRDPGAQERSSTSRRRRRASGAGTAAAHANTGSGRAELGADGPQSAEQQNSEHAAVCTV